MQPKVTAGDAAEAAQELTQLLLEMPVAEDGEQFAEAPTPETYELAGVGRLWELFGVVREVREGNFASVCFAFKAGVEDEVERQLEQGEAELTFSLVSRGPVATVDAEIKLPESSEVHCRRRWLAVRLGEDRFQLWHLGVPGAPYRSRKEVQELRERNKLRQPDERFRTLVSTKGFIPLCSLDEDRADRFLRAVLTDPTTKQSFRLSAVMALEYLPAELAIPALTEVAQGDDPVQRRTAVSALWRLDPQRALQPMLRLVHEESWEAMDFFHHVEDAGQALPLIAQAGDADVFRQCLSHLTVAASCDMAVPGLFAALDCDDEALRELAFRELCLLGDWRLAPLLIRRLQASAGEDRALIVRALARVPQPEVLTVLCEELGHAEEAVRLAALDALCQTHAVEPSVFGPLLDTALRDESERVRTSAWVTMRRYVGWLLDVVHNDDGSPTAEALQDPGWVPYLLAEEVAGVHEEHICVPLQPYLPEARELLSVYRTTRSKPLRQALLAVLRQRGDGVAEPLRALLNNPEEALQLFAITTAEQLNVRVLLPDLEERAKLLSKHSRLVKHASRQAVATIERAGRAGNEGAPPQQEHGWDRTLAPAMVLCSEKLAEHPVFETEVDWEADEPRPWQDLFRGDDHPSGDLVLGRPLRASARGSLEHTLGLIREELIQQWHASLLAFGEKPRRPTMGAHPTGSGYPLLAIDLPAGGTSTRCAVVCRLGEDDFLFWAAEESRGANPFGDPRGRD